MNDTSGNVAGNLAGHGITPIRDQVLVRQDPAHARLGNGLYAPDTCARELQDDYGTVIAVGKGRVNEVGRAIPLDVRVGDRVLFRRRPGSALVPDWREGGREGWKDLVMLREDDILAIIAS
ncbi:MAG: co-chaperone GroES [Kofleriaceae bacterium]